MTRSFQKIMINEDKVGQVKTVSHSQESDNNFCIMRLENKWMELKRIQNLLYGFKH